MEKMRATVFHGVNDIHVEEVARPSAGVGEAMIRVTLLDNLVTLRNYELSYYEQLSSVEKSIAALEPLVGVPLRQ